MQRVIVGLGAAILVAASAGTAVADENSSMVEEISPSSYRLSVWPSTVESALANPNLSAWNCDEGFVLVANYANDDMETYRDAYGFTSNCTQS